MQGFYSELVFWSSLFIFALFEVIYFARKSNKYLFQRWVANFSLLLVNRYLLIFILPLSLLELLSYSLSSLSLPLLVTAIPWGESLQEVSYISFFLYFIGYDCLAYWVHRLLHRISLFWRFHRVHHSDRLLDVSTSVRHHPVELLLVGYSSSLMLLLFKCPIEWLMIYILLTQLFAFFVHANIKIPTKLDDWLSMIFITPSLHSVHHSQYQPETDSNFGSILSLWDKLFGSYRENKLLISFGLDNKRDSEDQNLFELLKNPFRK